MSRSYGSLCEVGEGDCNEDVDCAGSLVCGTNNCLKWVCFNWTEQKIDSSPGRVIVLGIFLPELWGQNY